MKKVLLCSLVVLFLLVGFTGCSGESEEIQEGTSSADSSVEMMSEKQYRAMREIFLAQYRSAVATFQQQITSFSNSDDWWAQTQSIEQQLNSIANSFLSIAAQVPESERADFANIQSLVAAYQNAENTLNSIKGASSADQQSYLVNAANQVMQANTLWNQTIQ